MIISRRLVSMSRKFCLFVYYVEEIDNKQWMFKGAMALMEVWKVGWWKAR
jgi:hypothetical protein